MLKHVQQNLDLMMAQEAGLEQLVLTLEQQLAEKREQLILTRGAVQVLQHVLTTYKADGSASASQKPSMEDKQHATS